MKNKHQLVLALGEGSHTHIMTSNKPIVSEVNMETEEINFILEGTGVITHEEHARIVLPPGKYKKYPQQEYDPFANRMVNVFD